MCKYKNVVSILLSAIGFLNFGFIPATKQNLTGVFWGAFDPPTEAHAAIIAACLQDIPLKTLIVVVNNHPYKNYTYPLNVRLQLMEKIIESHATANIKLIAQDESNKVDFSTLKTITEGPLCAIAGYDAYKKWRNYSISEERLLYEMIAVVPRGDDLPIIFDENAFVLPIDRKYRYVSSTKVKSEMLRSVHEATTKSHPNLCPI